METQITIRAPKKVLAKWLKALRTGGYRQAKEALYDPVSYGFCCLGVLQHCVTGGEVEVCDYNPDRFASVPSQDWLDEHGISFSGGEGYGSGVNPFLPTLGTCAAYANDNGKTFKAIARAIEACAEGY